MSEIIKKDELCIELASDPHGTLSRVFLDTDNGIIPILGDQHGAHALTFEAVRIIHGVSIAEASDTTASMVSDTVARFKQLISGIEVDRQFKVRRTPSGLLNLFATQTAINTTREPLDVVSFCNVTYDDSITRVGSKISSLLFQGQVSVQGNLALRETFTAGTVQAHKLPVVPVRLMPGQPIAGSYLIDIEGCV